MIGTNLIWLKEKSFGLLIIYFKKYKCVILLLDEYYQNLFILQVHNIYKVKSICKIEYLMVLCKAYLQLLNTGPYSGPVPQCLWWLQARYF